MRELQVGVIGCGGHAQSHFSMIKAEPTVRLVAIAEISKKRLSKANAEHQPENAFQDYREMLDKCDLDVVYVVTMPGHLLPIVLDCLERGIHTSIEKSPGMNAEETREMLEATRRSKAKAIVSFNRRYIPQVLAVRKMLHERGGAFQGAAVYHKPVSGLARFDRQKVAPSEIVCDAVHHVDLLRWMAGDGEGAAANAVEVYAYSWNGQRDGTPRYNAVIEFHNGRRAVMMSHYGLGFRIQRAEFHAEDFSAYLDLTSSPKCELYADGKPYNDPLNLDEVGGAGFNETRHFADCILNDKPVWSGLDDALQTMVLCEAIERGHRGRLESDA